MQRYELLDKLGSGSFGDVFRARENLTGRLVAVKKPHTIVSRGNDQGFNVSMVREATLLCSLKTSQHENVLRLRDYYFQDMQIYLVFDLYYCNLREHIASIARTGSRTIPLEQVRSYMHQILSALEYCHDKRIMHRDLKPDNIMLDKDRVLLVVCDFGMARAFGSDHAYTPNCVTLWYRAPELFMGEKIYDSSIDVWSAGMVMAELIALKAVLATSRSEVDCLTALCRRFGTPDELSWPGVSELPFYSPWFPAWPFTRPSAAACPAQDMDPTTAHLLDGLLCMCPHRRLSAREALVKI